MVWLLALRLDDVKQDSVLYDEEVLSKVPHKESTYCTMQGGLVRGLYCSCLEGERPFWLAVELT